MVSCVSDTARTLGCRDGAAATHLKLISLLVIFFTSIIGISSPVLLARYFQGKPVYDKAILIIKCFAAGVILSTSLVHVLPEAFSALSDCHVVSRHPWKDFPFAGLVTLLGALLALFVDLTASSHVEHSHKPSVDYLPVGTQDGTVGKKVGNTLSNEDMLKLKQKLVSQVLEIGIIFHSVIIGVTMGMSQNQCTIRPLVLALAFHQIFEGMGLGGCIAQILCQKQRALSFFKNHWSRLHHPLWRSQPPIAILQSQINKVLLLTINKLELTKMDEDRDVSLVDDPALPNLLHGGSLCKSMPTTV